MPSYTNKAINTNEMQKWRNAINPDSISQVTNLINQKANQSDLNTTNDNVNVLTSNLAEKANQSDLDTTNDNVTSNTNTLETHTSQITSNTTAISNIGSATPKGTYATLSALQTAFPTGTTGIYVVTADGNWYYWNGTAWTSGGVYQSTTQANNSLPYNVLTDETKGLLNPNYTTLTPTFTSGSYISNLGILASSSGYQYSAPIQLLQNEKIVFIAAGYNQSVSMISTCDSTGVNIVAKTISLDSNSHIYTYTATTDCYVTLSCKTYTLIGKYYSDHALLNILNLKGKFTTLTPNFTSGSYITSSGSTSASTGYSYSDLITLNFGETIQFTATGYSTNVAMISTWDSTGTLFNTSVQSIDSTQRIYSYTATQTIEYVKVSAKTSLGYMVQKYVLDQELLNAVNTKFNTLSSGSENVTLTPNFTSGSYITTTGTLGISTGYGYSDLITLNFGETINFTAYGYLTYVSMISTWDSTGTIFNKCVQQSIDGTKRVYSYTATESIEYIKLSAKTSNGYSIQKYVLDPILQNAVNTRFNNLNDELNSNDYYIHLANNVLFIGDSLTQGYDGVKDIPWNYPFYMSKLSNWTVTNAGVGGITAQGWWTSENPKYDYSQFDTVVIFLGTNGGLTDTLASDTSTTPYADTNTGDYCKIIEAIKSQNSITQIFLCTMFSQHDTYKATTNNVINQIATKYSLPVIDLDVSPFNLDHSQDSLIHPNDDTHLGKVGYLQMANVVFKGMSEYMANNLSNYNV